ncbi:putative leucine-rich repeat receptor-like protein kinase [Planoprotostelium fungivorum]|uniref:Putative leucine-rich repeat receptor-like protein kinase n=1 Tax=Planoprotostelium fungivorum TaxID=1890364 RepID=A0A2P6MZH4_9EUKA|nr:putative leucine-rich repeat receptor-like protein kinase [Planoprotostelium fungivorum]
MSEWVNNQQRIFVFRSKRSGPEVHEVKPRNRVRPQLLSSCRDKSFAAQKEGLRGGTNGMSKDKKLKEFNDTKAPLSKRFKSLITFTEAASDDELGPFFQKDAYNIWQVFLDTFQAYEQQKTPRKFEEIERLLSIMRKIFVFLPQKIKEKWQIRSIAAIIEKLLDRNNRYEVRQLGLELLIMFLDDLDSPESAQNSAFGAVADLSVFVPAYPNAKIILPNKIPSADGAALLLPALGPPSVDDTVRIVEHFLTIITNNLRLFPLGWSLFKKYYIVYFYPDISKELGLLDKHSDYGFPIHSPFEMQNILIPKLKVWLGHRECLNVLWATQTDVGLLMEIYKQTLFLPVEHIETTRQSVQIFHNMLLVIEPSSPSTAIVQNPAFVNFQKYFLEGLPNLFVCESRTNTEARAALCVEVLELFRKAFNPLKLSSEIRDVLLFTLLEITNTLLKRDNNQELASSLAKDVIETVFYCWISSKCRDPEMWVRLQEGLWPIFHRAETVEQLKMILIHTSIILCNFVYPQIVEKEKVKLEGTSAKKNKDAPSLTPDDVSQIRRDPGPNPFEKLDWTHDYARFVWASLLQSFSATNHLKDNAIHASSLSAIVEVVEIFLKAESRAPYAAILAQTEEGGDSSIPLQLLNNFGPLLFEACYLSDKFEKSKIFAVEGLSRLICRYQRVNSMPHVILPHFYNIVHHLLCNPIPDNNTMTETVIDCTSNIFNLGLPGATVLLPYYLKEIKRLLKTEKTPLRIRRKCVILLASIISTLSQYSDVEIPMKYVGHQHRQQTKEVFGIEEKVTCAELREHITSLLVGEISFGPTEMKCMCLWSIYLMIMDRLYYNPDIAKIRELINVLIENTGVSVGTEIYDHMVGVTALDALVGLAQVIPELKNLDPSFPSSILNGIANNLMREMTSGGINRMEHLLCAHFDALAEWLLMEPSLLESADVAKLISLLISYGIHAKKLEIKKKKTKSNQKAKQPTEEVTAHKANIRFSALSLFYLLLHHHRSFPSVPGNNVCSSINEGDDQANDDVDYFIYNGEVVFSVVEVPDPASPSGRCTRVFSRTAAGKFAWNFWPVEGDKKNDDVISLIKRDSFISPGSAQPAPELIRKSEISGASVPELPVHRPNDTENVDKWDELLLHLGGKYPELLPEGQNTLLRPSLLPAQFLPSIANMQDMYIEQQKSDSSVQPVPCGPATRPLPLHLPVKSAGRQVLSQMGFLSDQLDNIKLVEPNKAFLLKLRNLDKAPTRDVIKVGLIYVKEGQETQHEILANDSASSHYHEFVSGLAWPVQLSSHRGYLAGLDPQGSNGKTSSYFAGPMLELMFHEIARMPTNPDDKQQLLKKRHVGNDAVHVIWNENGREYSPKTIVSQFNQAHIILCPLPNGMCRVVVAKKDEEVPVFGPLLHGMIVPKKILPLLARQTAINAHRYYYMDKHDSSYAARHRVLADTISKSTTKTSWEEQMLGVMASSESTNVRDSVVIPPMAVNSPPALLLGSTNSRTSTERTSVDKSRTSLPEDRCADTDVKEDKESDELDELFFHRLRYFWWTDDIGAHVKDRSRSASDELKREQETPGSSKTNGDLQKTIVVGTGSHVILSSPWISGGCSSIIRVSKESSYNNLDGTIPSTINELYNLTSLDLTGNSLRGLPSDLSGLSQLQVLSLGTNILSGDLGLFHTLPQIVFLNISFNTFEGSLHALGEQKTLQSFVAANNRIGGDLFQLPSWPSLTYLELDFNVISSSIPESFSMLNLSYLSLPRNILYGSLPSRWAQTLEYIDFSTGNLTGTIPDQLWNLPDLYYMDLDGHRFEGNISPNIRADSNLQYVILAGNLFTGPLPPSVGNMKKLIVLVMSFQQITGSIPQELNQTPIQYLDVSYCNMSGPVPYIPTLSILSLSSNNFSGEFPSDYAGSYLYSLDLSQNSMSGEILDTLAACPYLQVINVAGNGFSGSVNSSMTFPQGLISFLLANNSFTGMLPVSFFQTPNLKYVDISHNYFYGSLYLPTTPISLAYLDASFNQFNGTFPVLDNVPLLTYLDLSHNLLQTTRITVIRNMPLLTYMDASYNQISGTLSDLTGLNSVNIIKGNDEQTDKSKLKTLKVAHNLFYGTMSSHGDSLASIETMDLSANQFEGSLPYSFSRLTGLIHLNISHNRLTGGIPPGVASITTLSVFDASYNKLVGSINAFSVAKSLTILALDGNLLTYLPPSVAVLPLLTWLSVSNNFLSGDIPQIFTRESNLQHLDLSYNFLTGSVDNLLSNTRNMKVVDLSNNNLSGRISAVISDPAMFDVSYNEIGGGVSWMSSLISVQELYIHHNKFNGSVPSMSNRQHMTHLYVQDNELSGQFPDLTSSDNLQMLYAQNNNFSGQNSHSVKVSAIDAPLVALNMSHNNLQFIQSINSQYLTSRERSIYNGVDDTSTACRATCQSGGDKLQTLRMRISGDVSTFSRDDFASSICRITNISSSRLTINSIRSGSVIVDMTLTGPNGAFNQGSSDRIVTILQQTPSSTFAQNGIQMLDPIVSPIPAPEKTSLSTGATVGIVVAVIFIVFMLVIGIILFFYARLREQRRRELLGGIVTNVDLSNINLGAAKKSVVDFSELKNLKQIGSGAFGVVYRAEWRSLSVAVKMVKQGSINANQLEEFVREVAILQGLRAHPNVVLFDDSSMGLTFPPDPLALITEFCEGGTFLRMSQVPWALRYRFIQGIALGMLHLHLEKIVHRDLAVRNILLSKYLEPKVSDFGLSREQQTADEDGPSLTTSNIGPIKWMSPESLKSQQYSTKSDVFSFGVVVWEILTVREPWEDIPHLEVALNVADGKRLPVPDPCEEGMHALMHRCWQDNPRDRPSFKDICHYLGVGSIMPQGNLTPLSTPENSAGMSFHDVTPGASGLSFDLDSLGGDQARRYEWIPPVSNSLGSGRQVKEREEVILTEEELTQYSAVEMRSME